MHYFIYAVYLRIPDLDFDDNFKSIIKLMYNLYFTLAEKYMNRFHSENGVRFAEPAR